MPLFPAVSLAAPLALARVPVQSIFLSLVSLVGGTPDYFPPERVLAMRDASEDVYQADTADMWSLGVVMCARIYFSLMSRHSLLPTYHSQRLTHCL